RADEVTGERDPTELLQRAEVDVVTAAVARREDVREQACARARQIRKRLVAQAGLEQPPHQISVGEPARRPVDAPAREDDVASGFVELFRDLAPGLPAAYDQHAARMKLVGIAIAVGVDREDTVRKRRGGRRSMRTLVRAGCEHDSLRL